MGLFFYNKNGSIRSIGDLPTTNIIEPYSAALGKAKSYNSLFHMSKKRMYRQLTSDFDKFSNDAAQYAVDHLEADYKYNALFNAKNYRKLFNMSKSRLINQLTSFIDGFTEEEANYAINHLDD